MNFLKKGRMVERRVKNYSFYKTAVGFKRLYFPQLLRGETCCITAKGKIEILERA